MADEVYEGAIGIDLGLFNLSTLPPAPTDIHKVPPTRASPIMRVPMSRSVSSELNYLVFHREFEGKVGANAFSHSCQ